MSAEMALPPDVRLMNATTALGYAGVLLALLAVAVPWVLANPVFAIGHIVVSGDTQHSSAASLRASVLPRLQGNFFTLDLGATQRAFQEVPWVRHATVQRQFPGRLNVTLQEHVPVARWGTGAGKNTADGSKEDASSEESQSTYLLNSHGEVFEISATDAQVAVHAALPQLSGPDGQAGEVLEVYQRLAPLTVPLRLPLTELQRLARGGWQARLGNGARVELGQGAARELAQRMERFATTAPQIAERHQRSAEAIEYADLRYASGYAIRLRGVGTATGGTQ